MEEAIWNLLVLIVILKASICSATPLDDYVKKADSHYKYKLIQSYTYDDCAVYVLNMTSQKWMDENFSNISIWFHHVTISVPQTLISRDTSFLLVDGGTNNLRPPTKGGRAAKLSCTMARNSQTVSVVLGQIPNQPMMFMNDPKKKRRTEDDVIAWTWKIYLANSTDPEILLRMPMTKAVVRAMDTVTDFCKRIPDGFRNISRFVVAGASKRGWTTWTAAAVDKRVIGIAPVVLDILNMKKNLHHHFRAYGNWSFAFEPYYECDVMRYADSPVFQKMASIIDPYSYRERLAMPKFILTAAGDEFMLPDDSQYFYDKMKGPTYLRIVPNIEHYILSHYIDVDNSVTAFTKAVVSTSFGGQITLYSETTPSSVTAYYARTISNKRRDFRLLVANPRNVTQPYPQPIIWFQDAVRHVGNRTYKSEYRRPIEGWLAHFIQVQYKGVGGSTLKFTSEVNIIPDVFPFPDCHSWSCRGGLV